jgi:hypothetical protein
VAVSYAGREERQGSRMALGVVDASCKGQGSIASAAKLLGKPFVVWVEHAGVVVMENIIGSYDVFLCLNAPIHRPRSGVAILRRQYLRPRPLLP